MTLAFLRAFGLLLLKLPMILLGLPVVWFAIPQALYASGPKPFTQFPEHGNWSLVRLPEWALWWDNAFDGMLGDKRGWWANECKGNHTSWFNMWRWAAIRNPANYFSRNICGVDVSELRIVQVAGSIKDEGSDGFYLLKGTDAFGKTYARFYCEKRLYKSFGLMLDFGWKIKLSHNYTPTDAPEKDRLKGIVFAPSFWKELT